MPCCHHADFGLCRHHRAAGLPPTALPAHCPPKAVPAPRPRTPTRRRWSPRQVYDVVAAVEHYHKFVPWCQRSTVLLRRPPGYLEAELEVGFQMFVER